MIIAKYKANSTDCLPTFNGGYIYTSSYVDNGDGTYTFTLESDTNFTQVSFNTLSSLLTIDKLAVTNAVSSLGSAFYRCPNLTYINTEGWDTSNVWNFISTFYECPKLESLDLRKLNTGSATSMAYMFRACSSLTSLDLRNFNTSKVNGMNNMFDSCSGLTSLNISGWNTSSLKSVHNMFAGCSSLTSLNLSGWETSSINSTSSMFAGCSSLVSLNLDGWVAGNSTSMSGMFYNCKSLKSLDLSSFDTEKVTDLSTMFFNCSSLTTLDLSNFNTSKVNSTYQMFNGCSSLKYLDVSNFDTSNINNMASMFNGCSSLVELDLGSFNTSNVANMATIFYKCSSLKHLDLSNFNTDKTTSINAGFNLCSNLSKIGMLSCNKKTINDLITQIKPINTSLKKEIYIMDIEPSEMETIDNIAYIKAEEYEEEVILPCQLSKVGDVIDKIYYDKQAEKYIIEKNIDEELNIVEKQLVETNINLMNIDTSKYDNTYVSIPSKLKNELKVNEEYCKLDILSSDGGENSINNELFLSEPLRRIGDVSDRLYWDFTKEKYVIERNIGVADFSKVDVNDFGHFSYNAHNGFSNIAMNKASFNKHFLPYKAEGTMNALCTCFNIEGTTYQNYKECFALHADGDQSVQFNLSNERFDDDLSKKSAINILKGMGTVIYYELNTPIYEELDINRMDLKSYIPTTHLTTPNIPLKTSITVDANIAKYKPLELLPDTKYTLLVDAMGGENNTVNIDLGGATNRFKPTQYAYGKNKVSITTPSTLSTDYLSIYGETNKVKDIMLIQGDVNQHPEYFDGTQSTGELQGDGSYKIDILSQSETLDSRDIQGNIPITLEGTNEGKYITIDEIYGNTWQDNENLSDIRSVGELQEDGTYKVDVISHNDNLIPSDTKLIVGRTGDGVSISYANNMATTSPIENKNIKVGDTIYFTYLNDTDINYWGYRFHFMDKDKKLIKVHGLEASTTIPITEDFAYYSFTVRSADSSITNDNDILSKGVSIDKLCVNKIDSKFFCPPTSQTKSIYLPQPLSMIGEYQDKLYWDDENGKYCIEQNTDRIIIDGNAQVQMCSDSQLANLTNQNYTACYVMWNSLIGGSFTGNNHTNLLSMHKYQYDPVGGATVVGDGVSISTQYIRIILAKSHFNSETITSNDVKEYLASNPICLYYALNSLNVVELDIEEKISLNSYNETTYITTNSNVEHEIKGLYDEVESHNVSILLDSPLTNDDKIYYDNGYKVSRNGNIETPVTKGNEINLPKLYQGINTYINTTTGNIKPSEIKVEYKEFS